MEAKFIIYLLIICLISTKAIDVSTVEELHKALEKAKAGQVIELSPGEYDYSTYDERKSDFKLTANGTESSPIILTAKDPDNPPLLRGPATTGIILYITGNYWIVENIRIGFCGRGIVLEKASHNIIRNIEIFSVGSGAIIVRYGSKYNLFQNCYIHNTGLSNQLFGNAFDIGIEHKETTTANNHIADFNIIEKCVFRYISSEPIIIREYTTGNEIIGNTFYGDGINGKNNADNFIRISGSDNYIHNNVGYRNENKYIVHAFEIKKVEEDTGNGNIFESNILFMDRPYEEIYNEKRMYIVDGVDAKFSVKNNKVDYGEGLLDANSEEFYNSEYITFLE